MYWLSVLSISQPFKSKLQNTWFQNNKNRIYNSKQNTQLFQRYTLMIKLEHLICIYGEIIVIWPGQREYLWKKFQLIHGRLQCYALKTQKSQLKFSSMIRNGWWELTKFLMCLEMLIFKYILVLILNKMLLLIHLLYSHRSSITQGN